MLKQYVILSTLHFYDACKLRGFFSPKSTNYEHARVYDIQYYFFFFFLNNIKMFLYVYKKFKYSQWYGGLTGKKKLILCK